MASRGQVQIDVVADTSKFAAQVRRDLKAALKTVKVSPKVEIDPDTSGESARAAAKISQELNAELEAALRDVKVKADVDVDTSGSSKKARAAGRKIGTSFTTALTKALASGAAGIGKALTGIFGLLATVGKWALLAAAIAQAAVVAGQFAGALLPAVGIVAALPAVLLAAGAALGTLKLALRGVGDALKAGFSGDTDKFAEALKGLAPAAQDAVRAIVSLKPALDSLGKAVQQSFFQGFTDQIKALAKVYLPVLSKQLPAISAGLGGFVTKFAEAAKLPEVVSAINDVLAGTARAFVNASGGVGALTKGLAQAAKASLPLVEGLGIAFGDLTKRFGTFLEQASKSGQLDAFIADALGVFHKLGDLLSNVGGIIFTVFHAASAGGGDLLGTLVQLTGSFSAFLQTAKGAAALEAIFDALSQVGFAFSEVFAKVLPLIADAVTIIAPVIGDIAVAIGGVLQAVSPLITLVGSLVASIGDELANAITSVTPIIGAMVEILKNGLGETLPRIAKAILGIVVAVAPLLLVFADLIGVIAGQLADTFEKIAPLISKFVVALGGTLGKVLPKITGAILQLVEGLAPLLPIVADMAGLIADQLADAFVEIVPILVTVANILVGAIGRELPKLSKAFFELVTKITPLLVPLAQLVAQLVDGLIPPLVKLIPLIVDMAVKLAGPLIDAISLLVPNFIKIVTVIAEALIPVIPKLTDAMVQILNAIIPIIPSILELGLAFLPLVPSFLQLTSALVTLLLPALIAFITITVKITQWIIEQWLPSLKLLIAVVVAGTSGMSKFATAIHDAFVWLVQWSSHLVGTISGLPGKIVGALGDLSGLLFNAGANIIRGLINGIEGMLGRLKATMSNVISSGVRDFLPFSPAKTGPLSGSGSPERSGMRIAEGVADGITKRQSELQRAMASMTSGLALAATPDIPDASVMGGDGASAGQPGASGVRVWGNQPPAAAPGLTLVSDGSDMSNLLVKVISKAVRIQGGNVQQVLGKNLGGAQ